VQPGVVDLAGRVLADGFEHRDDVTFLASTPDGCPGRIVPP
jgi:hypothetical protein